MAKNKKSNGSGVPVWLIVVGVILLLNFNWLWALAPFLLIGFILWKAGVFKPRTTTKNISSASMQEVRMDKYKIMTEGRSVESIRYLASAVGVSFDTAMRDLQKMVAEGRFGPRAYINYVDKTVVLESAASAARATSGPANAAPRNRPSYGAEGSNMFSRDEASDTKKKTGSKTAAIKMPDLSSYDTLEKNMLALGIALIVIGVITGFVGDTIPLSILIAASGAGCLVYRLFLKKRENRFKLYAAALAGRDYEQISTLASKAGVSTKKCYKDLEIMLEKEFLPQTAYIDHGEGILVLKAGAAPQQKKEPPVTEPEADNEDRYKAVLRQIRKLNDDIPDEGVSRRIDEMEDLTSRIFNAVREKPEKEPQIKSFMSYYLPTTLKLLNSYAEFERSGATGENITQTKAKIERILDTLVDGFRKQLDKLYEADAMDISSDIDVLETMLRRDGLTGDESPFKTVQQGKK